MTRLVVIAGPTASGKSALALAVARATGGTIINADSMQVYRDLAVLTARPGPEAMRAVPHRLYGALDGAELCSAARWAGMARTEIEVAAGSGNLPILVGGTGLYLRSLLHGIAPIPDIPEDFRQTIRRLHRELGAESFHRRLAALDPESASRLLPSDSQRIIRAYEVIAATGRTLGDWHRAQSRSAPGDAVKAFILSPPREALYAACNARLVRMLEQGALDEVRALAARGLAADLPVMKALGVPELRRHLTGELRLAEAVDLAQRSTRHYAKRQTTWFRHQMPEAECLVAQFSHSLGVSVCQKIREWS